MTTAEILREARALYESTPSHTRGSVPEGTHCVYSAIDAVAPGDDEWARGVSAMREASDTDLLSIWNAEASTEEVLAAFDRAIASCEAS